MAAQEGHVDIVNLLVAAGGDVNAANCDGYTPVYMAVLEGHLNIK